MFIDLRKLAARSSRYRAAGGYDGASRLARITQAFTRVRGRGIANTLLNRLETHRPRVSENPKLWCAMITTLCWAYVNVWGMVFLTP
ncbi:hypothetical protein KCP78_11940 [Salmonella enterica subsp. enterica]|nr:hypothetical protein KCP78_11940 [Salmonella enterica subsp. enterica]